MSTYPEPKPTFKDPSYIFSWWAVTYPPKPSTQFPAQAQTLSTLSKPSVLSLLPTQYINTTQLPLTRSVMIISPKDALWTVVRPSKPVTKPLNNSTHRKSKIFESIILQNWKIFDFMAHHLAWLLHRTRWISRGFYTGSQATGHGLST